MNLRDRIVDALERAAETGATDYELSCTLGVARGTVAAARSTLNGQIVDSGARRPTDTGRTARVWRSAGVSGPVAHRDVPVPHAPLLSTDLDDLADRLRRLAVGRVWNLQCRAAVYSIEWWQRVPANALPGEAIGHAYRVEGSSLGAALRKAVRKAVKVAGLDDSAR